MFTCTTCGSEYQMGRHIYGGKQIPRYQMGVCKSCYEANWDGWAPDYEGKIITHLEEKGLPVPERNNKGWLPRD